MHSTSSPRSPPDRVCCVCWHPVSPPLFLLPLQGQYETRLLEQSIYKICALLAVGFGDAGAEVIAENIKKEGDLNPCMPGKKTVSMG